VRRGGVATGQDEAVVVDEAAPGSAVHADLGFDITSQYFFRGLLQEDSGFIWQPWAEVGIDLVDDDSMSLGATLGTWNSFHDSTDTAGTTDNFTEHWYESDIYFGLGLGVQNFSFDLVYTIYTSPSDAFNSIDEISLGVSYDDSGLWGESGFALNPHMLVAFETHDRGGSEDSYLELGIEPGWQFELGETTLDVTVPVTVGFGLDDYYVDSNGDDDSFGYLDVGVATGLPLPVPEQYGSWSLSGGVHLLYLGDAAEDVNDGDDVEVIGTIGISVSF
jgi:hypothetical protein